MRLPRFALGLAALASATAAFAETRAPPQPWVRNVPPDRQCIRFVDFDWIRYMRETDALEKRGRKEAAARRSRALGEALWYLGRGTGLVCSCASREATLADLRRIVPELKRRPAIAYQDMPAAEHVANVIVGIENAGVAVAPPSHEGCKR